MWRCWVVASCFLVPLISWAGAAFSAAATGAGDEAVWIGAKKDFQLKREGRFSWRWNHGETSSVSLGGKWPQDWSRCNVLEFWLHSPEATRNGIMLIVRSESPTTDGMDYYSLPIRIAWKGWKKFVVPFKEMGVAREPVGWSKIDNVSFTAAGWGNTPNPKLTLHIDGWRVEHSDAPARRGPTMDDKTFFASLRYDLPGMAAVKKAVDAGDYAAAKKALAKHLRNRTWPRWTFDWRDRPTKNVANLKDRAPDQWDYYSRFIDLNWSGWKHFSLAKTDFSPKAFVEGEGWRGKKPIGWNWIRYMAFNASGWGLTPDPRVKLCFDDIRLVMKNGEVVSLGDFEQDEDGWSGLTRTKKLAKKGEWAGCWENMALETRVAKMDIPHDWTDVERLEFWAHLEKPTRARVILVLDSDAPKIPERVQKFMNHFFEYKYAGAPAFSIQFPPDRIDWKANPTKGQYRTHLWNESINRHFHLAEMAQAYWDTGRPEIAKEIAWQLADWIEKNPPPLASSGNEAPGGSYAWQTLTTSIRLASTWPNTIYRCLDSPYFTPELLTTIMKSVHDQAEHLMTWKTGGNWLTSESFGLYTAGMLFPEFKDAERWRKEAVLRLYNQLKEEVYPDGMEYELASGYNCWVVSEYVDLLKRAKLNHLESEIPADYKARIEKMFHYLTYASAPDRRLCALNDSGRVDIRRLLAEGCALYPDRKDFLYVATDGLDGQEPTKRSVAFPYCGHYVMRSGWDRDARFLLFDSGPFGYGHQHEDKLHFIVYAYGRVLILDPGNYSYDRSKWRRYCITSPGHNVILVDGEGQHRRGQRETYVWPKPWDKPAPPGNTTRWITTKDFDYADGTYADGYGPKNDKAVTHRRRIVFVKPDYWIVIDALTATDGKEHRYDALFHLDANEAQLDEKTHCVATNEKDRANVALFFAPPNGSRIEIVKGQEDPVQGWANGPWRAVPTAVVHMKGSKTTHLITVVYPVPAKGKCPVRRVTAAEISSAAGAGAQIEFENGARDVVLFSEKPGQAVHCGGVETKAECCVVRFDKDGRETKRFEVK